MNAEDEDCDNEILIIDLDDEPMELKEEINDEMQSLLNKETNDNKADDDRSVGKQPVKKNHVTDVCHRTEEQNTKESYIKVIDDANCGNFSSSIDCRIYGVNNNKKSKSYTINKTNVTTGNRSQNYRFLSNVRGQNHHSMDVNTFEMDSRVRAECREESQSRDGTVYVPDVYEPGYAMDDNMLHTLINTNTFRPWTIDAFNQDVVPNVAYRIQPAPNTCRSEVNAYRADSSLSFDDYRHAIMNRNVYNHAHRLNALNNDNEHPKINRNACIHAHPPECSLNIDDNRMNRYAYTYNYAHREDASSIDDYRHTNINRNVNNHAHKPEDALYMNEYRHAVMSRHAYNDACRSQVPLNLHPYRSRAELANIYRPDMANMDACRLEPALNRMACYPKVAVDVYNSPQVAHINTYRHALNTDAYRQEEAALNLVASRRPEEPLNVGAIRSETDMSMNANRLQTTLTTRNRAKVPLATDINKPKSHNPGIPGGTVYRKVLKHKTSTDVAGNSKVILNTDMGSEAGVQINWCKPGVPVRTNRPDTVILSTKDIYTTTTSSTQSQTTIPVITNTTNVRDYNDCKKVSQDISSNETTLSKKPQRDKLKNTNQIEEIAALNENVYANTAIGRDINEVAQKSNERFLIVFFTRVKELVKETFPEFAKSLQWEIENLGKKTEDKKVKTDIQYICPLYCSVSTYSFPCFDAMDDDNKVEKHINRAQICDVCSCIQSCYRLYKKKYFNLLSTFIGKNKERDTEKQEAINSTSIKIDGAGENEVQNVKCGRTHCDVNMSRFRDKKSRTDLEYSKNDVQNVYQDFPTVNKVADKVDHENKSSDKHPKTKQTMEFTLFNALSTLTFNLPNSIRENTSVPPNMTPSKRINEDVYVNISSNKNNDSINKIAPEKQAVTIALNINEETVTDRKNKMDEDKFSKDEPNLILSLSVNETNNADIISSKLRNKIGRKPDTVFTCHICSCMFAYFTLFMSHMQKEHNINGIDEEIPDDYIARKCPFCGIYSKQKYHNDHVRRSHPEIFTHKGEPIKIKMKKKDRKKKSRKRKFIFTCLICHERLMSSEVNGHREKKHKGVSVAKMFTKKLTGSE